jgi:hypothetical protein
MPPITDPSMLAQIQQQQSQTQQPNVDQQGLAAPPTMGSDGLPTLINPRAVQLDLAAQTAARGQDSERRQEQNDALGNAIKREEFKQRYGYDPLNPPANVTSANDPNAPTGEDFLKTKDPGYAAIIQGFDQGRVPPGSSYSYRSPQYMQLLKDTAQYDPGFDLTTFKRRQAALQSFTSGPDGRTMDRVNQALQHLSIFYNDAQNLNNYKQGLLSLPENAAHVALMNFENDPRYTAAKESRDAVATELAAAFKGGNDPALSSLEHWQNVLSLNNSPEGFDSAAKTAAQLLGGRIDAANFRFKQAVGPNADIFSLISPQAKQAYQKFTADDFGQTPDQKAQNTPFTPPQQDKELSTTEQAIQLPKGYQDEHTAFLQAHPPGTLTAQDYENFRKAMDAKYLSGGATSNLSPEGVQNFVNSYNHGNDPANVTIPVGNKPLSTAGHIAAMLSDNPIAAAVANAGNAATLGLVKAAMPQDDKDKFAMLSADNPGSSLAGDIGGSLIGMGGLSRAALKGLEAAGVSADTLATLLGGEGRAAALGNVANSAGYGGIRGFNDANVGQGGEGAIEGAAGGAVGGLGGEAIAKGVTPLLSDETIANLAKLSGVDLTTLQRLGLGKAEETLRSVPFAKGAQVNAVKSFNIDNANRALSYIGSSVPKGMPAGPALNDYINTQANNFYNTIKPKIGGVVDDQFNNGINAINALADTPEKQAMMGEINKAIGLFKDANGNYTGAGYQAASQRLRALTDLFSTQAENQGSVAAQDMSRAAEQARKQMQFVVQRQTPDVAADLKNVERTWAQKVRIEDASNRAMASNGGIYSPSQYTTSIKKFDTSANKGYTSRGNAFDQPYSMAAQDIMGSGSVAERTPLRDTALTLGGLSSLGYFNPTVAAALGGGGAAVYMPGVKRLTQGILSGTRPAIINNEATRNAIADAIRKHLTGD